MSIKSSILLLNVRLRKVFKTESSGVKILREIIFVPDIIDCFNFSIFVFGLTVSLLGHSEYRDLLRKSISRENF